MDSSLQGFLSPSRLAPYKLPGETEDQAFARYQWNIRLAEAMLPALSYVEVGLRNGLDHAIAGLYGPDWLLTSSRKLDLSNNDSRDIENLKTDFIRRKGYPATHSDLLAKLSFGFWIAFFHKRYIPGLWSRGKTL
jgi:hypothetical protein